MNVIDPVDVYTNGKKPDIKRSQIIDPTLSNLKPQTDTTSIYSSESGYTIIDPTKALPAPAYSKSKKQKK